MDDALSPGDRHLLSVLASEGGLLYVAQIDYRTPFDTDEVRVRCRRLAERGLVEWIFDCMVRITTQGRRHAAPDEVTVEIDASD